jgi:hypothetical protein
VTNWDEGAGRVSRSFNDWYLVDRDQSVFLSKGLEFATEVYDRLWNDIAHQPGDPDGPDVPDLFDAAVDGLWPHDYEWMHLAGVLKDGVTNFEVYLERAADEMLRTHGKQFAERGRAAPWERLMSFYKLIGVRIGPRPVSEVRELRHILTHRRGELRTEKQRERFAGSQESFMQSVAHLEAADVAHRLDVLGDAVRSIDPAVYDHTWGGTRSAELAALVDDPLLPKRRDRSGSRRWWWRR